MLQGEDAGHTRNSSSTSAKSQTGSAGYSSQSSQAAHSRQSSEDSSQNRWDKGELIMVIMLTCYYRNLSGVSSDTGIFGSMERDKRRKKLDSGRVDAEDVINELMEDMQLHDSGTAQEG